MDIKYRARFSALIAEETFLQISSTCLPQESWASMVRPKDLVSSTLLIIWSSILISTSSHWADSLCLDPIIISLICFSNIYTEPGLAGQSASQRASEQCEAYVRGTQVSLKNIPVSLNSTQVSLSSSPVSFMVSIYVGGCSCLASLTCLARMARTFGSHASHVWLVWLAG